MFLPDQLFVYDITEKFCFINPIYNFILESNIKRSHSFRFSGEYNTMSLWNIQWKLTHFTHREIYLVFKSGFIKIFIKQIQIQMCSTGLISGTTIIFGVH